MTKRIWQGNGFRLWVLVAAVLSASVRAFAADSVAINKEWYNSTGTQMVTPTNLSATVTVKATSTFAWLKIIYPANNTANPVITSAVLAPEGAGSSWPKEVSTIFNNARSITANSTKNLSNVVLLFADGAQQKFDGLTGYSKTFSGTGTNAGKTVVGVWIKSGSNKSDDGPGYGVFMGKALMAAAGSRYTVTETGLPSGWTVTGLGTFTSKGGSDSHTVQNRMKLVANPGLSLVKTAGTAADGEVLAITGAGSVTYKYVVKNTGDTWLKNVTVTDDKLGEIGTLESQLAPGASVTLTKMATISEEVTNVASVVAIPSTQEGEAIAGQAWLTNTDSAVVFVVVPDAHESVTLVKEWYDSSSNLLSVPPNLSTTVTVRATSAYSWSQIVFPAGNAANYTVTSAALAPEGAGSSWPAEISATFNNNHSVTANSTKNLSNVVLKFADGSVQKFDSLTGYTGTFAGTGANVGKTIVGIWIKSGDNKSYDGPGYGVYLAPALMIPSGASYTVTETGLPNGWTCTSGLGTFSSTGAGATHTVRNQMNPELTPAVHLVKTAGTAEDGEVFSINGAGSVTYTFVVQNIGNTWLKDLVVTDDKLGSIGTVAGPLAAGATATLTKSVTVSESVTNMGTVVGTPSTQAGEVLPGQPQVTNTDDAVVTVIPLCGLGDFVWLDANANGIQDAGEAGLANVAVQLLDGDGSEIGSPVVTDATGHYLFANLVAGTYRVQFETPDGYILSESGEGDDAGKDSDAIAPDGRTAAVVLAAGATNLTLDAGMWYPQPGVQLVKTAGTASDGGIHTIVGPGSVTYAFEVRNTGNTWLKDVTVTDDKIGLIGTVPGMLAPAASTTLTATVTVSASVTNIGSVIATPAIFSGDGVPGQSDIGADDPAIVQVTPLELASLGDRVWVDANRDGTQDEGELGLIGVLVTLIDTNGATVGLTSTASDGSYLFSNLQAGEYRVKFELPTAAWHFTVAGQGEDATSDSDADVATGLTAPVTLGAGENNLTVDAGVYGGMPPGYCDTLTVGENFNALIFGNFTATGGDIEGRLAVGGTAHLPSGYSVGMATVGEAIPPLNGSADMLIVGGDLYDGTGDINGNIVHGGTRFGPIKYMGSNTIRRVASVTFDEAGNVPDDGSGVSFAAIHQQLLLASAMIGAMDDRGVVEMELDKTDHIITFVGNDPNLNVFNVNAADWSGSQMDIVIVAPVDSTVVFNIHGTSVNLSNGAIRLTGVANDHILFNYVDASEIVTSGFTHEGAVLAPFSGGRFSGGAFEGFGFFGGNVETSIGFEFHHFPFRGRICTEAEASPAVRLATTAGDADDGTVLTVLGGSSVTVSYRVTNTGNTWLDRVRVVDAGLGEIGTLAERLAPCASATLTAFLPSVTDDCVLHGTVTGRAVREDGTLWNGYVAVSDADDASIKIGSPSGEEGNPDSSEAWQRPDFAVTAIEFVDEPTLTGEVFSVFVTVDNHGELAGDAGRLSLYNSKPTAATAGQLGDASMSVGVLMPGDSKTLKFNSVKAAGTAGTHHLRAYVDSLDSVHEWSEGDNQLTVTYDLNAIYMGITVTEEGTELSWNSFPGQKYTLYRCTDLTKGFLLYKSHIESTPPTNTYIDAESTGMRFYRLNVER